MARKSTDYVQFKLRIREGLRRKIEKAAERQAISANAEAVERIERTFEQDEAIAAAAKDMEAREAELQEMWRQQQEEEVRKDAKYQTAIRDSKILDMMIDDKYAALIIRSIFAAVLLDKPDWSTPESRKGFADRLHRIITNVDSSGYLEDDE